MRQIMTRYSMLINLVKKCGLKKYYIYFKKAHIYKAYHFLYIWVSLINRLFNLRKKLIIIMLEIL